MGQDNVLDCPDLQNILLQVVIVHSGSGSMKVIDGHSMSAGFLELCKYLRKQLSLSFHN